MQFITLPKHLALCGRTQDGNIKLIYPNNEIKILTNTDGRPLEMQFDKEDNLIVCDAYKNLISINHKGEITVLAFCETLFFLFADT